MTDNDFTLDVGGDIQPGTYLCTLIALDRVSYTEDEDRTDTFGNKHLAGEVTEKLRWTFVNDDDAEISGSTSMATGPRSKMRAWMTGIGIDISQPQKLKLPDLLGRTALVSVALNDNGYAAIASVVSPPKSKA